MCENERQVEGDSCELCSETEKFQEEFACDNLCNCSSIGTNGNTSVCQGVCISKTLFSCRLRISWLWCIYTCNFLFIKLCQSLSALVRGLNMYSHKKVDKSLILSNKILFITFWQQSDAKEPYDGISSVTLEGCYKWICMQFCGNVITRFFCI